METLSPPSPQTAGVLIRGTFPFYQHEYRFCKWRAVGPDLIISSAGLFYKLETENPRV